MTLEIIVGVIALCFVLLTIFLIVTLQRLCKVLKNVDQVMRALTRSENGLGKITDILLFISEGIQLFKKIKNEMKE